VPSNFDPATANPNMILQPCLSCGIKPTYPHILKAAVKNAAGRQSSRSTYQAKAQPLVEPQGHYDDESRNEYSGATSSQTNGLPEIPKLQCPRCTFLNHPSLMTCEMCGLSLSSIQFRAPDDHGYYFQRPESPGPNLYGNGKDLGNDTECVKFSFRAGGEKDFCEKLKGAMVQRKWFLQNAPPVPDSYPYPSPSYESRSTMTPGGQTRPPADRPRAPGIAGLEAKGLQLRKKNEVMIGSAFEDLDALMASAKEIVALAESFAKKSDDGSADANQIIADSAKSLSMVTTKNMLGSNTGSESLYLSELSRNLAEYLTDDSKSVLRKEGGIMSLVDLWAVFNRARGGVELVSPLEFEKAARLWEKLKLPVRLRQFKNGLLVVQQADRTDDKTIAQLLAWLQELHASLPSDDNVPWDIKTFGRGITAQEAARRFGWSVGVANEELEMAEEKGELCREEGVEGLRFWENWVMSDDADGEDDDDDDGISVDPLYDIDPIKQNLEDMGLF
jgi:ESCRT-II complex subunit VPS36